MFLFCIESSHSKGMGHLFRALTISKYLNQLGKRTVLVLLDGTRGSIDWLESQSIDCLFVDAANGVGWELDLIRKYKPNVWINDRLNTNFSHANQIKQSGVFLVTFDDAGEGAKLADLHIAPLANIRKQVVLGKEVLVGVEYLTFSNELIKLRRLHDGNRGIIVTLGGSDTYSVTDRIIKHLKEVNIPATIILGPESNTSFFGKEIYSNNLVIKKSVKSLYYELSCHDLAITGGGLTAFEAAALGVPTITIANELWEKDYALHLQNCGCSLFCGDHSQLNESLICKKHDIKKMSYAALESIDINGLPKIAYHLLKFDRDYH